MQQYLCCYKIMSCFIKEINKTYTYLIAKNSSSSVIDSLSSETVVSTLSKPAVNNEKEKVLRLVLQLFLK